MKTIIITIQIILFSFIGKSQTYIIIVPPPNHSVPTYQISENNSQVRNDDNNSDFLQTGNNPKFTIEDFFSYVKEGLEIVKGIQEIRYNNLNYRHQKILGNQEIQYNNLQYQQAQIQMQSQGATNPQVIYPSGNTGSYQW